MSNTDEIIENSSEEVLNQATKRKRQRVVKKDAVYTVTGLEAENLDTAVKRRTIKKKIQESQLPLFTEVEGEQTDKESQTSEQPEETNPQSLVAEEQTSQIPEEQQKPETEQNEQPAQDVKEPQHPSELFKPHRGRKSKAELAAIAAWEAKQREIAGNAVATDIEESDEQSEEDAQTEEQQNTTAELLETETDETLIPQTDENKTEKEEVINNVVKDLLESAMNKQQTNQQSEDFIIIQDIPVEDFGVLTNYDMLDNPINVPEKTEHKPIHTETSTTAQQFQFDDLIKGRGVLEMMPDGYGFLRSSEYNYISSPDDVYVSGQNVKKYGLKVGDVVECSVRPPLEGEKFFTLTSIDFINGRKPHEVRDRIPFEHLTPLFPDVKFDLCGDPKTTNKSTRIVDLFSPIGKGQRALIVAQPKTGKTILMKDIANAIAANHPEAYLMMLLIDERPEEVTDMARTVNAEVIASTFDEPADKHVKIAGLVLEKAKRMVECGHDVVIFLDSITRLARAYNTVAPASGKVLTGGVDANALQKPKRFFGAARNIEGGGSLTIIATALIDTGSKMDEVIFEEFKGTGNMELQLERALSNKRIYPAVNLVQSSTRRDDLLQDKNTLDKMWIMRKYIADMNAIEAMNIVQQHMGRTRNNDEFLMSMNS